MHKNFRPREIRKLNKLRVKAAGDGVRNGGLEVYTAVGNVKALHEGWAGEKRGRRGEEHVRDGGRLSWQRAESQPRSDGAGQNGRASPIYA